MGELKSKIAIIGCGNVGMCAACAFMLRGGAPFIPPVDITAGSYPYIADSDHASAQTIRDVIRQTEI